MAKKIKKKAGRPKSIKTPAIMWQLFLKYQSETKANPIKIKDWVGKDAEMIERERERPLTMDGFTNYLDNQGIITDITDYIENKENRYSAFVRICSRIKRTIRQDQIEGGMANIYNPSITQRLNGLVDKVDHTTKGEKMPLPPQIFFKIDDEK